MSSPPTKTHRPPKLILGCSNWGSATDPFTRITTSKQGARLLEAFSSYGHDTLDTSRRYPPQAPGTSEALIGETLAQLKSHDDAAGASLAASIRVDTKTLSLPGDHRPEKLQDSIAASLAALNVSSVATIYLHFPDRSVPFSDPISTLSHAVSTGRAKQWGLSNYTVDDLREILRLCAENDWVRPAVYQGEYNALSRASEDLIRFCHDEGISFYAYSPGAGGVFSPSGSRIGAATPAGQRVRELYGGEDMQSAVQRVRDVAERKGLGGHEIAIRWAFWDGILNENDGVVIGASSEAQLRETCEFLKKGGLEDEARDAVEGVWGAVKK